MNKFKFSLLIVAALAMASSSAIAQPPGGRGGPGPRGGGEAPPRNPIMEALDANGDHEISAKEIENAVAALKKLDTNKDGKLSQEDMRPERGEREGGRDRGREGGRQRDGEARDGEGGDRGAREGRGRERGEGERGRGRGEGPNEGGPRSPERFVEHAMEFDKNEDGNLSKKELTAFAAEMERQGPPHGGPEGRPEGKREGGPEGRPERGRNRGEGGERPQGDRPRRPEAE